jgi:hypothetical protein
MLSPRRPAPLKWYYRPVGVLVLLFLVLGPLGLPFLWRSPSFSRAMKILLTALVIGYVALFIDETVRVLRAIDQMDILGKVTDF